MRAHVLNPLAAAVLCALFPSPVYSDASSIGSQQSSQAPLAPSPEAARRNAFKIFNAVHSAARQWGSSLNHNGMSFFLATVPEGSVFFHGDGKPDRPEGMEWLAFEIEHAQVFARSEDPHEDWQEPPPPEASRHDLLRYEGHGGKSLLAQAAARPAIPDDQQRPIALPDGDSSGPDDGDGDGDGGRRRPRRPRAHRGYLQTYRAQRPLNLLYIDGMAAGKCAYGPLDTQDYVLLDWEVDRPDSGWGDELARAKQLCDVANKWGDAGTPIDGFVRMEAGFEIIYCHFEEGGGLEPIAVDASPFMNETGWVDWKASNFEWIRACSLRYNGFPAERITIDWSSMVSAFFYDVNLTNPDPTRPELPRVLNTTRWERQAIKQRVEEVLQDRHPAKRHGETSRPSVNWQGVVDMIVTRYSDRLAQLASGDLSADESRYIINFLLSPFTDATSPAPYRPSLARCASLHLEPALARNGTSAWTAQDELIGAAVGAVSRRICQVLIDAWVALGSTDSRQQKWRQEEEEEKGEMVRVDESAAGLIGELGWTTWRECGKCASPREVCFVAMFPMGRPEDHYAPRCKNATELGWGMGMSYWRWDPRGDGKPPAAPDK
ncbi:hypothetical protein RB595_000369 [Gaeumannomyces hyphopodioides]